MYLQKEPFYILVKYNRLKTQVQVLRINIIVLRHFFVVRVTSVMVIVVGFLVRFRFIITANSVLYSVHLRTHVVNSINRGFGEVSSADCFLLITVVYCRPSDFYQE